MTFDELQKACEAIEVLYRKRGYIVQAILPAQKIAEGILIIQVIEAKLGAVIVDEQEQGSRFGKERAQNYVLDANQIGNPLDTHAIARAVIILNEVPGVAVTSALEAGANEGETNLRVNLTETGLFTARLEANNYGSRSTGATQASVSANSNSNSNSEACAAATADNAKAGAVPAATPGHATNRRGGSPDGIA